MQSAQTDLKIRALSQTAQQLMAEGRLDDAARSWEQVLAIAPDHPQALLRLGQHRFFKRDMEGARALLERAAHADPNNVNAALSIAFVFRAQNDAQNEMAALVRALTIDPYFLPALLAKGMLLERTGQIRLAARTYADAMQVAPPDEQLAPELRSALSHGRDIARDNARALEAHLDARLGAKMAQHKGEKLARFEECRAIVLGTKKVYTQQPSLLHVPRLPAIGFYERDAFPWLSSLEAETPRIREEALAMHDDGSDFHPYVNHADGTPVNQWAELNHSPRWSTYFFWKDGRRIDRQCEKCPVTAAASEAVPDVLKIPNYGPTIMYSALAPRTRIPSHSSVTNARLVVHLPLIVPDGCRFRVGNETRPWREGEAWVFDDTIEHEAWNDSDRYRVILMIDIWNPLLSAAERDLVAELLNGVRDYYGSERVDTITGLPTESDQTPV